MPLFVFVPVLSGARFVVYSEFVAFKKNVLMLFCIALTAPTNEFVGFYSIAPNGAIGEYRDSPSRSMFSAALPSRS